MLVPFHRIEEFAGFFPGHLPGRPLIVSRLFRITRTLRLAGIWSRRWLARTFRRLIAL
jgi:hypothetical protein